MSHQDREAPEAGRADGRRSRPLIPRAGWTIGRLVLTDERLSV